MYLATGGGRTICKVRWAIESGSVFKFAINKAFTISREYFRRGQSCIPSSIPEHQDYDTQRPEVDFASKIISHRERRVFIALTLCCNL